MRDEQQSVIASHVGGAVPDPTGVVPVSGKFEELVQRCAQLESENAVLAYKLRRMRRTIRRLGQDNAFIQRRLREHIRKKDVSAAETTALATAVSAKTGTDPSTAFEHKKPAKSDAIDSQEAQPKSTEKTLNATSGVPSTLVPPSTPVNKATASNGHIGRSSNIKLEPQQMSKKSGIVRNAISTNKDVPDK